MRVKRPTLLGVLAAGLLCATGAAYGQEGGGAPPPPPPQEPPPESKPPEPPPEAPPQEPPAEPAKPKPKPRGRTPEPEPAKPAEPPPETQEPAKPGEEPGAKPGEKPAAPSAKPPAKRRPRISPRLPRRDRDLEARGGLWLALVSGSVRKDLVGTLGTRTDFSDLDLDGATLAVPLEAMFHLSPRLSVSAEFFYAATGERGTTLERKVTFNGATYPAGTKMETLLDVIVAGLGARYFANSSEISSFDVEAGVRYLGSQIRMRADGQTRRSVETTDAFIPYLGFHGQVWLYKELRLEAGGRIGVLAIGNNSDNQTNGMFEFYARFSLPIPLPGHLGERAQARVSLGYHFFSLNAERKDGGAQEDLELTIQGPLLSLLLRF